MRDDYYLNLLDWSNNDDLAVGLDRSVYIRAMKRNASPCSAAKLCDLDCGYVASVSWSGQSPKHLAVGSSEGDVQIWDKVTNKCLRTMTGHRSKVNSLAWNGFVLSTGGHEGWIFHRDVRVHHHHFAKVHAHSGPVCGLKWSHDGKQIASGSNDCKVRIWSIRKNTLPSLESCRHTAAVKALDWSPHKPGLLATGGGTGDSCIHLWNTTNDVTVRSVDTGSQVCGLLWSKNVNEIISTHGYGSLFEVGLWKCPSMTKIACLPGHSRRVLFLSVSPDGCRIATGSGDSTVRIWDAFPAADKAPASQLATFLPSTIR
jgi:cell division cycle 20-like protein 1 (cofactor of APC complex)